MSPRSAGLLELAVLLAVTRLGDEAYGLGIRSDVSRRMDHDYSIGAIYTTLQRLEDKGFLTSYTTEPLPARGGRSRRQFKVSASGKRAIRIAQRTSASMWAGLKPPTPERA
jgi:PadR family transcriptional regulator PadR